MPNSINTEENFNSFLERNLSNNNDIKLPYSFIPNGVSNKITRFYSIKNSLWFSRLKLNNNEKIYYFGFKTDEKLGERNIIIYPRAILRFNENINKSTLRFWKDNVLLLVKTQEKSDVYNKLNELFILKRPTKSKDSELFYVDLGNLNSKKFLKNLELFIKTFNFEQNFNNRELIILNIIEDEIEDDNEPKSNNEVNLNRLNFNLNVINLKNNIYKSNLDSNNQKRLNDYIFDVDDDGDFSFTEEFRKSFDKNDAEILMDLNRHVSKLFNESDYDSFLNKLISIINNPNFSFDEPESNNDTDSLEESTLKNEMHVKEDLQGSDEKTIVKSVEDTLADSVKPEIHNDTYEELEGTNFEDNTIDDEFKFEVNLNSDLFNEIIGSIDITSSSFYSDDDVEETSKLNLISDLKSYSSNISFKLSAKSLNADERNLIINKIESDINENLIFGEIKPIVNFYIDQYKLNKDIVLSNKCLTEYLQSNSFELLVSEYGYDKNIVDNIINRVKNDISNNGLEYKNVETQFEIYFRSFKSNQRYYAELEHCKGKAKFYINQYNLTSDELNAIFVKMENKIDNNQGAMDSINEQIEKEIGMLVFENKEEACDYITDFPIEDLMNTLQLNHEGCEEIKNKIRYLVYNENLRSFEISMEYMKELKLKMLRNGALRNEWLLRS